MAQIEEIIVEVKVDAGDTAQRLADVKQRMNELKSERKALNDAIKESGTVEAEQAKRLAEIQGELKTLTAEEKMYTAQLNIATQGNKTYGDSLVEMSAQLAQLKADYRGMTKEQRESAAGKELQDSIKNLDATLKETDGTLGDFQRNVGNYQSALLGLNGNVLKVANLFKGGFRQGISAAGSAIKTLGKTMLATPFGWILAIIGAIVAIFSKLKDALMKNDDAMTALKKGLAALQPILNVVNKLFSALATVLAKVVEWTVKSVTWIAELIPAYRKAAEEAKELVQAEDDLEEAQRNYTVAAAERQREIAELKKKERADETLTYQEREKIFQQIDELEKKDLEERKKLAAENLRIIEEKAKQEADTSDETKDKIAEARAAMLQAETDYINGTTRIAARARSVREQEAKDAEDAAERQRQAWKKAQQERQQALKTELDEMRKLQDLRLQFEQNEYVRERKQTELNYSRQIEDLKKRLDTEKNLTAKARETINQEVMTLEALKLQELARLDKEHNDFIKQQDEDLASWVERNFAESLAHVGEAYEKEQEKRRQAWQQEQLRYENDLQEKINKIYGSTTELAQAELERATQFHQQLVNLDAETHKALFSNEEDYRAAVLAAEADILQARTKSQEAMRSQIDETQKTLSAVTSALGDLYEAAGEDAESYEKFKKALAIVDAVINMATTIAAATTASTAGDPYTMALRIAANVATVTAQFAAVIASIKSAQIPSAGNYSAGGIVPGDSYSGDKLTARVNSGEMILNKSQQQELFRLLAAGVPPRTVDYERIADIVRIAAKNMPPPVLDYRELTMFGKKVSMIERKLNN